MNEEGAKFKFEKQLPAPDNVKKKLKPSSKKPWVLKSKWCDDARFRSGRYEQKNGVWVRISEKSYSYKEILEMRENDEIGKYDFYQAFLGPKPYGINRYKTKKSALTAWENFCKKGDREEGGIYWIENEKTGEKIEL